MKLKIYFFILILSKHQIVKCDNIIDSVKSTINDFSRGLVNSVGGIVKKIGNAFTRSLPKDKQKIEQFILEERIKQSFNDFVEKTAASTASPDHINMRSEPTALMSTVQLAILHGKRIESFVITSRDGYLLTLHRVFNTTKRLKHQKSVILHHGLLGSSADWILLGPRNSLPYILADAGYDVWMVNARGNYYSRGHLTKRVNSSTFWQFSFQEMGLYDLPAVIDYIRAKKNSTAKINFIGHSMGATVLMVMLSEHPKYNDYLRIGILMAPLAFMTHIQGPMRLLTAMSMRPPQPFLKVIGDTEFIPSRKIPRIMAAKFCSGPRVYCSNPLLFLAGGIRDDVTLDASFVARLLYHAPAGASTNTILHYGQLVQNSKFHRFGRSSSEFPLYRVKLPIVLISSSEDWLATVPDIMRLYFSIANPLDHHVIYGKNISHTEFVWGSNAHEVVFPKVLDILIRGLNYTAESDNEVKRK